MHPALRKSLSDYRGEYVSTRYCLWTAGIMFVNGILVMVIINMAGWCA